MKLFFYKLTHWEYWPFQVVYIPIYFLWVYYALKERSLFFFNAVNPSMRNGGFFMVSKAEIYALLPQQFYPKTCLVTAVLTELELLKVLQKNQFNFPLIVKPDMGLRGAAVKKIENIEALLNYHNMAQFDYLLQALIPFTNEVGIFYVRYPHEEKGRITGIVSKEFLTITGDGKSTRAELVLKNPRAAMQLGALQKEMGKRLQEVVPNGNQERVVSIGNHRLGTKFVDASSWITPQLTATVDGLCKQIEGFYYGRLDVMYASLDELTQGHNFAVVELNGAMSEPAHIYDPSHSIWFAWKTLFKHITYLFEISKSNHALGHPYLSFKDGIKQYQLHQKHSQKIFKI